LQSKKDSSGSENGDSQGENGEGTNTKKTKKGQSQWVQDIERDNVCDKHAGQACYVLPSGAHYQLTMADKSLWGMMMVRIAQIIFIGMINANISQTQGHKSTTIPPRQLRLEDVSPEGTKTARTTKRHPAQPPPYSPSVSHHYQRHLEIPSSDAIDELDDPTLFPRVASWLQELDEGPRGADQHNFAQYTDALEKNMLMRVFQLEDLTEEKLLTVCASMVTGTAALVLQYARKDCGKIRKVEARRLRDARLQPKRYL
jgi:hypothetical protein